MGKKLTACNSELVPETFKLSLSIAIAVLSVPAEGEGAEAFPGTSAAAVRRLPGLLNYLPGLDLEINAVPLLGASRISPLAFFLVSPFPHS